MADAGSIYAEAGAHIGEHLGHSINAILADSQKKQQQSQLMQGYLDVARRLQVPDAASGKPKSVFDQKSLDIIQDMLAHHNTAGAAAQEAALGIGKGMQDRYQTAAAKQQAATLLQQQRQQAMQQGPVTVTDQTGRRYMWNPHTNAYQADTAMPRDASGRTSEEQMNLQKALAQQQQAQQQVQRSAFNVGLKAMNLSPQALFDPSKQEQGTYVQGRGFLSQDDLQPNPDGTPNTDPTHVRIGYEPPSTELLKAGPNKGQPVDPGNPGRVLSLDEFNALRDTQAQLAGPTANQAWKWINTSPETTQTDFNGDPWTQESIDQYNTLLPKVQKQFHKQVAQGFEGSSTPTLKADTAPSSAPAPAFPLQNQAPVSSTSGATDPLPDTAPPTDDGTDEGE